ncbi:MAG: DUF1573 domain-containing protein [Firmicutes bacterium]|nr:DUF1573 domain-containing protein [Bacillota bacterium]
MPNLTGESFQATVDEYLIRHRSILDVLSKLQEATARVNRALAKAVTTCGCVEISASRQRIPEGVEFPRLKEFMATHLKGELCESCREIVETELGQGLFYFTALCSLLGFRIEEIMAREEERIATLGPYNLT